MYIVNGIAFAGTKASETFVQAVKPLDDLMMIVTFTSGEKRLFDATQLLAFPAFQPLKDEKIFKLYKFRTMTDERDENGELLPDDVRLTSFGKWLRSTSMDELPEAFNILNGDRGIIGTTKKNIDFSSVVTV